MIRLSYLCKAVFMTGLCACLCFHTPWQEARAGGNEQINQKYEVRIVKVPKEHEPGLREYVYEDGSVVREEIPATGHVWSEWIVDVEPTYTKEGHRYRVCTKIPGKPHYEEQTIPKLVRGANAESGDAGQMDVTMRASSHLDADSAQNSNVSNVTPSQNVVQHEADASVLQESPSGETAALVKPEGEGDVMSRAIVEDVFVQDERNNGFNVVDAVFVAGMVGVFAFAYIFVLPLIMVLIWAAKKRRKILGEKCY